MNHVERLLTVFELAKEGDWPIRSYSNGQQKKIAICSALVTEAPILLLDEPFSGGLDPAGIMALKCILRHLAKSAGATVILTTPVPELVEELADRIVVIRDGELLAFDTPDGLRAAHGFDGAAHRSAAKADFPGGDWEYRAVFEGGEAMIRFLSGRIRTWVWPSWFLAIFAAFYLGYEAMLAYLRWEHHFSRSDLREFFGQRDGCMLFLVTAAGALRAGSFHPLFWTDYGRWLARTPWRVSKPLPLRPVHLTVDDIIFLLLVVLLLHHPYFDVLRTPLLFLFGYFAVVCVSLWMTDSTVYAWALTFGFGLAVRFWMVPWAALAVEATLYPLALLGLRQSLTDFPWSKPELLFERRPGLKHEGSKNRGKLGPSTDIGEWLAQKQPRSLGWPFDLLRPNQPPMRISWQAGIAVSLLFGWWTYAVLANPLDPEFRRMLQGAGLSLFPLVLAFVRTARYCMNYSPPISLMGRLLTMRWIVLGYDKVFVAPILILAISLCGIWLNRLGLDQTILVPVVVGSAMLAFLNVGPTFREWQHTANHRISPRYNSRTHLKL